MATTKAQRLVNLVICLRSSSAFLTADQIRFMVQGYDDCESESAFFRMFERDKRELRSGGVPIEQGEARSANNTVGYRIPAAAYELPEIAVTPEQAGVLAIAAEVWRSGERSAQAGGALAKLSAAGIDPVRDMVTSVDVGDPHEISIAAALAEAIGNGTIVRFDHTSSGALTPTSRTVEPWWAGSRQGRWYLVGFDRDRQAPRTFRLVRISAIKAGKETRRATVPPQTEVLELVDAAIARVNPAVTAEIWVAEERAAELRAMASTAIEKFPQSTGAVLKIMAPLGELAALVAAQGADAIALRPQQLCDRVAKILNTAAEIGS